MPIKVIKIPAHVADVAIALTEAENLAYKKCKKIIERNKSKFVECGLALKEVRDSKLYRVDYKTFEAFVEAEWNYGRSYAYRLIQAADSVQKIDTLSPTGDISPETERAARAAIEAAKAAEKEAEKVDEPITIDLDKTGYPIPEGAMECWKRTKEVEKLVSLIVTAIKAIGHLDKEDNMYHAAGLQNIISLLENARRQLGEAVPYAVCPSCQGLNPKTCLLCCGLGMISRFKYKTAIPEEQKAVREKSCK